MSLMDTRGNLNMNPFYYIVRDLDIINALKVYCHIDIIAEWAFLVLCQRLSAENNDSDVISPVRP